jgi:hypothetical protein
MAKRDLGDAAARALTRPGVGAALLAGLGVYLVLAVKSLLGTLVYLLTSPGYLQDIGMYAFLILRGTAPVAFGAPLPFAIGVFLSFWQVAPVAPQLRMAHVVTRALLAAAVGALAALVIGFVVAGLVLLATTPPGAVLGAGLPRIMDEVLGAGRGALAAALGILIDGLVVVPLAALLLWGWLRAHPPSRPPAGAVDEV